MAEPTSTESPVVARRRTREMQAVVDPQAEITALKDQVAALENALAAKDRRIQAMKEIGRSLGAILDLDEVLQLMMKHVTSLLEADRSTLYILDTRKKELWSKIAQGDDVAEIRLPLGVGVAGWVAKTGEPLNIRDAYADKRFNQAVDKKTGYRTQNMLAHPMRDHRGNILGVIQALNKKGGFTEEDERTLEAIASQAAQALENAVLYQEALKQNQVLAATRDQLSNKLAELDLLFEFTQTMAHARNRSEIVRTALERASALMGAEGAALLLVEGPTASTLLYTQDETELRTISADPTEGIPGWVASKAQPLVVQDCSKEKRHSKTMNKAWDQQLRNMCAVPLLSSEGASNGALVLFNRGDGFEDEHMLMLNMLANHVSKALEAAQIKEKDQNERRLQTIGQMLSGVVHDFKTPMTIISGYVQLMASSTSQDEREEYADLILKQFDNLSQMTKDLLQFARGEVEVLLRKVYLQQFIAEMEELLKHIFDDSKVQLAVDGKFRGTVRMDTTRMTRVITNIARNAKEAMPSGGKFSFTVEQSGESVLFIFSDNGPGIPEALEGRLFTEFATHGKADGTGLGLAVVKRIVQEHHGDITYESRKGKGTTFTVRLPL